MTIMKLTSLHLPHRESMKAKPSYWQFTLLTARQKFTWITSLMDCSSCSKFNNSHATEIWLSVKTMRTLWEVRNVHTCRWLIQTDFRSAAIVSSLRHSTVTENKFSTLSQFGLARSFVAHGKCCSISTDSEQATPKKEIKRMSNILSNSSGLWYPKWPEAQRANGAF